MSSVILIFNENHETKLIKVFTFIYEEKLDALTKTTYAHYIYRDLRRHGGKMWGTKADSTNCLDSVFSHESEKNIFRGSEKARSKI